MILDYNAEGLGAAITYLMGGGALRIFSPTEVNEFTFSLAAVPDIAALGSAMTSIHVHGGGRRVVSIQALNERLYELFGFGTTREGNFLMLKRPQPEQKTNVGFCYEKDEQGRMMIVGDYPREVDRAYMSLFKLPATVLDADTEHPYIYSNTAKIYLSDLRAAADYCGDRLAVDGDTVHLITPRGE